MKKDIVERLRDPNIESDALCHAADEAAAEIERLRALVEELALDLECEVEARYDGVKNHPRMTPCYNQDMDIVRRARAGLAVEQTSDKVEVDVALRGGPGKGYPCALPATIECAKYVCQEHRKCIYGDVDRQTPITTEELDKAQFGRVIHKRADQVCPFENPGFKLPVDDPCPVCGVMHCECNTIKDKCPYRGRVGECS